METSPPFPKVPASEITATLHFIHHSHRLSPYFHFLHKLTIDPCWYRWYLQCPDFIQPTSIHPVFVLALKVFLFSIVYHLVEEKTSKSITGFNYSWYITLFELTCAFLLELIERLSIAYHEIASFDSFPSDLSTPHNDPHSQSHSPQTLSSSSSTDPDTTIIDIDDPSPSSIPSKSHSNALWRTVSALRSLSSDFHFRTSYLLLALNLILSRGLATIVLQYYDMDYPTYAICRNSKMVFVMALSVVWLRKPYRCSDWILVLLTSLSVLSFRLASHDLWFSSANTMVCTLPKCVWMHINFESVFCSEFVHGVWARNKRIYPIKCCLLHFKWCNHVMSHCHVFCKFFLRTTTWCGEISNSFLPHRQSLLVWPHGRFTLLFLNMARQRL